MRLPEFAFVLIALLAARGSLVAAAAGVLGGALLAARWAWLQDAAPLAIVDLVAVPASYVLIGYLWRWALGRIVRQETAHRGEVARTALALAVAKGAAESTAADLRQIRAEATPGLVLLRDGAPLEPESIKQLSMAEASIRDRIRVPRLQVPQVQRAARSARHRGASVVMIGEPTDVRPVISDELAAALARILDDVDSGSVTIRCLPARRAAAVTVLVVTDSGAELMSLRDDGTRAVAE